MKKPSFILIGFGERKLTQLLQEVKEKPEKLHDVALLCMTEVPHYRSITASSQAEKEAFLDYIDLMSDYLKEKTE